MSQDSLEKSQGEGSRGGKVIGQTKFDKHPDQVALEEDKKRDQSKYKDWTAEQHEEQSQRHHGNMIRARKEGKDSVERWEKNEMIRHQYLAKEKSKEIKKALNTLELAYLEGHIDTDTIEKARSKAGVYANTHENRKLGRVGQKYKEGKEDEKDDFNHHRLMAGYHSIKEKQISDEQEDLKSSSDKNLHKRAEEMEKERKYHAQKEGEHAKRAHELHNPSKHGSWNSTIPSEDKVLKYGEFQKQSSQSEVEHKHDLKEGDRVRLAGGKFQRVISISGNIVRISQDSTSDPEYVHIAKLFRPSGEAVIKDTPKSEKLKNASDHIIRDGKSLTIDILDPDSGEKKFKEGDRIKFGSKTGTVGKEIEDDIHEVIVDGSEAKTEDDLKKLGWSEERIKAAREGIEEKHPKIKDSLDIDDHDTRLKYYEVKDQHPNLSWEDHKNLAMDLYPKKKQALRAYLDNNDPSKESELKNKYNELESANDYHEKMAKQKYKKANPDYHIAKFDKDHLRYFMTSKSDAR